MNIALLCVLIIVTVQTDCFHVDNSSPSHNKDTGERILLRKLQAFQHDEPKETKTATWNQILADALVNRLKIFSFKVTESSPNDVEVKNNFLTNCVSQLMHLYKVLIYDKYHTRIDNNVNNENTEFDTEIYKVQNDGTKVVVEKDIDDPKGEVEIVEPRYHGKLCVNCDPTDTANGVTESAETLEINKKTETVTDCPDGLVAGEDGRCTKPKSNYILSIPYRCPSGYRRDWLGVCRPPL